MTWLCYSLLFLSFVAQRVYPTSVTDIQGPAFQSPLNGKSVTNVSGIVTAKSTNGFWITGPASSDTRVSNDLFVFTTSSTTLSQVSVGDQITLSGKVSEFRSSSSPNDLLSTELDSPTSIKVVSSRNTVTPIILGKDRSPPTELLSALDTGPQGWLSVPGNTTRVESVNATLQPDTYGLDFWESLEGQLVTVPSPVAIDFPNSFGEFWVYGDWPVTGKNSRGGLTITLDSNGIPDANPETVIIGSPLDGTTNPSVAVGTTLSDITGVVVFQFGFFYILPTTAPTVKTSPSTNVPPTSITPSSAACTVTLGDYNVENLAPNSSHLPTVAAHIATHLASPDIVFLQEIQDDSGPTDDGTVSANKTLDTLVAAITSAGSTVAYSYAYVSPVNDQDGGEPGGNIRQVYLYNPEKVSLAPGSPPGGPTDVTQVITTSSGSLSLSFNPGRVDPVNSAWDDSRKPLAAVWVTGAGHRFFTINLQLIAKLDSSSTSGDARTPVNAGVVQRTSQVNTTATFVQSIYAKDSNASVVVGGDCNEYLQTTSVFAAFDGLLTDADGLAGIDPVEQYTYVFDQNTEQLDHMFLSPAIQARAGVLAEHVHVNNWSPSLAQRASDHDPTVVQFKVCV